MSIQENSSKMPLFFGQSIDENVRIRPGNPMYSSFLIVGLDSEGEPVWDGGYSVDMSQKIEKMQEQGFEIQKIYNQITPQAQIKAVKMVRQGKSLFDVDTYLLAEKPEKSK